MNWIQWVTFGIAVVGATLGIFNAWWAVRKDMVRLRVRNRVLVVSTGHVTLCVEVINTGYIPVTITEIGYTESLFAKKKLVITDDFLRQLSLPHRMEPRTVVTMTVTPAGLDMPEMRRMAYSYAKTACGVVSRCRLPKEWRTEAADQFRTVAREAKERAEQDGWKINP